MLTEQDKRAIIDVYVDSEEHEKKALIKELSSVYQEPQFQIRQVLIDAKVYGKQEAKSQKEQYAEALWAVTGIPRQEWMKLRLDSKKQLMEIFKQANHREVK